MFKEFIMEYQEIIFSVTSFIISIIAVFISVHQTKLSNKQHLFDRRLKLYSIYFEVLSNVELIKNEPSLNKINTVQDAQKLMWALLSSKSFDDCFTLYVSDREFIDIRKYWENMNKHYDFMNEAELIFPKKIGNAVSNILHSYVQLVNQCVGYHDFYIKEMKQHTSMDGTVLEKDFSEEYRKREYQYIIDINKDFETLKRLGPFLDKKKFDKRIRKLIKL